MAHSPATVALRDDFRDLIRNARLLDSATTPCGGDMPVRQAHALTLIAERDHAPTLRDLVAELHIDKSNVTRLCQELASGGLVSMSRCADDGRARRVRLTPRGRRVASRVNRRSGDLFADVLTQLSEAERRAVCVGLPALTRALRLCVAGGRA